MAWKLCVSANLVRHGLFIDGLSVHKITVISPECFFVSLPTIDQEGARQQAIISARITAKRVRRLLAQLRKQQKGQGYIIVKTRLRWVIS